MTCMPGLERSTENTVWSPKAWAGMGEGAELGIPSHGGGMRNFGKKLSQNPVFWCIYW